MFYDCPDLVERLYDAMCASDCWFMEKFCRDVGAVPQICLNLGSGQPQEAAEWVRYVNQKWNGGKGGLLWELGNELWGNFQIGYPTLRRVAERTKAFSDAVRAADPRGAWIATGQAEVGFTADTFGRNVPPWSCNQTDVNYYGGLWAHLECVPSGDKSRPGGETRLSIQQVATAANIEAVEP
jgi:hypothetical protein